MLAHVAFPLRHGRPFGAAAAFLTFLIAFAEFAAVVYVASAFLEFRVSPSFLDVVLPAGYITAAGASASMFVATRRRSVQITKQLETGSRDLEKARQQVLKELAKERVRR